MDDRTAAAPAPDRATSRPRVAAVWWALGSGVLTVVGLAVLTAALLVLHVLGHGAVTVLTPQAQVVAPDPGRYGLALAIGVVVDVVVAAALLQLAPRTAVGRWAPAAQGLVSAVAAAACAVCALLLTLGINPIEFFLVR